jgi:hypothetical protein
MPTTPTSKPTEEHKDILNACAEIADKHTELLLNEGIIPRDVAPHVMLALMNVQIAAIKGILASDDDIKAAVPTLEFSHIDHVVKEISATIRARN